MKKFFKSMMLVMGLAMIFGHKDAVAQVNQQEQSVFGCYARLANDTLIVGNQVIERQYLWNKGNLITVGFRDKRREQPLSFDSKDPDFYLPGEPVESDRGILRLERVDYSPKWKEHLAVEVQCRLGNLNVKRLIRVFPETPALQVTYFFRGNADSHWIFRTASPEELNNLEDNSKGLGQKPFAPVLDMVALPGRHWKMKTVKFFDITDRYNTLTTETSELLYRRNIHTGNLATLENLVDGSRFFMLKEAPSFYSQLAYPGADFVTDMGTIQAIGIGVDSADVEGDQWVQGYGCVSGFGGFSELEMLTALRTYQKNIFPGYASYEPIVITNTWGDRGQDTKIGETFLVGEIEAAQKLGTNYLQIDDGWQAGRSGNSAFEGGSFEGIWRGREFWEVSPEKFPNGFSPVAKAAEKAGINLSIWFNPDSKQSYLNWKKDAGVLLDFYNDYGIRIFKIDGLRIGNKTAEERLRKMFDYIYDNSSGEISYDLDVTASKRFGYHYFNEYGVYWVSNRYTDWRNYYPYTVLRNLWMLSRYVPAEKLQFPFLNIWRNKDVYPNDPFAPSTVGFDYAFATVMAGQPMGFFETSGLPEQAFKIKDLIKTYMSVQKDFHSGTILPIGEEPSGRSWTGFQSITGDTGGYLLVFRELNRDDETEIKTWLPAGKKVILKKIAGDGENFSVIPDSEGKIKVHLPESDSWGLFSYEIDF